jgi:Mycothiol-dependent nitroreductase Rv2466c
MGKTAKKRGHKKDKHENDKHEKGRHDKDHRLKKSRPEKSRPQKSRESASVPTTELEGAGLPTSATYGSSTPVAPTSVVDFWFDPISPWAWLTSRWLLDVQEVRPVKLVWHLLSMSVSGDGADVSADVRAQLDAGWAPVRVTQAVAEQFGQEQLGAFYTALGTRIHVRNEGFGREVLEAALTEVGLPVELSDVGYVGDNDDALRQSYGEAIQLVGFESGPPVTQIDGAAFFGPVVSPPPRGEEAGQIFDAIARLDAFAGFRELTRGRPEQPILE